MKGYLGAHQHHEYKEGIVCAWSTVGEHNDPTCWEDATLDIVWQQVCDACKEHFKSPVCERHAHLALEHQGRSVKSVLPLSYTEPNPDDAVIAEMEQEFQ